MGTAGPLPAAVKVGAVFVALALPALGLGWFASSQQARAAQGEPPPAVAEPDPGLRVTTPLLSSRRVPGVVSGKVAAAPMIEALGAVGRSLPPTSCLSVALDGQTVFETGATTPVLPASNQKLFTGAVAVEVLGADHVFETTVSADAPPTDTAAAGVVERLYLVGGGDPVLSTKGYLAALGAQGKEVPDPATALEDLADRVVASGLREVRGGIVADESRYDTERYVPSWPDSYRTAGEAGPLGALLVDDGFGSFTPLRQVPDPAIHAASTFEELLRQRGVTVSGAPGVGVAPPGAPVVATVRSAPLSAVVGEMLRTSDDNTAELLLKELGVARGGLGSREAGLTVVRDTLTAWGVPMTGTVLVDGSGLDRGNRTTCAALLAVLERSPLGSPVAEGLPVAATTGTLASSFGGNPMAGRLRAKTGSLSGAKALSGLVPVEGRGPIQFALVDNGPGAAGRAPSVWDQLGRAFASYPAPADLAALEPTPPAAG